MSYATSKSQRVRDNEISQINLQEINVNIQLKQISTSISYRQKIIGL